MTEQQEFDDTWESQDAESAKTPPDGSTTDTGGEKPGAGDGASPGADAGQAGGDEGKTETPEERIARLEKESAEARSEAERANQRWNTLQGMFRSEVEKEVEKRLKGEPKDQDTGASTDQLYEQLEKAFEENDARKAVALQKQINEAEGNQRAEQLRTEQKEALNANRSELTWNQTVAEVEKQYPMLDPKSREANRVAINAVNGHVGQLIAGGMSDVEALRKAVEETMPAFADKTSETGAKATPAPDGGDAETVPTRRSRSGPHRQPSKDDFDGAWNEATST